MDSRSKAFLPKCSHNLGWQQKGAFLPSKTSFVLINNCFFFSDYSTCETTRERLRSWPKWSKSRSHLKKVEQWLKRSMRTDIWNVRPRTRKECAKCLKLQLVQPCKSNEENAQNVFLSKPSSYFCHTSTTTFHLLLLQLLHSTITTIATCFSFLS